MNLPTEFEKDNLKVKVFNTRKEMGDNAGKDIAYCIRKLQETKDEINMIFAAAPSQNETLAALVAEQGICWERINAFHMDEYIGLSKDAPQGFGNFLKERLFDKLPFKAVYYVYGEKESAEETCKRYTELIKAHPIDIVCLGIGENGHIAFNDPWVADFNDKEVIKKVELDPVCRNQQVNDGCFATLDEVPKYALTLTVPTLFNADYLFCTVPARTKAEAVYNTVNSPINEEVPATIMRKHGAAVMYCDPDSAAKLLK
ncbi:MAG: glucosamine-6-phosphate deaminase [Clostridia bacterium]|nr:glucosamine-6-phosphate deaminase [Clostridia bacterium]